MEPPIAATGMASVATPAASGENPSPPWYMTLSAIIMPPIAPMNPTTTASPAMYGRRRRIEGSTSGARPRRTRRPWSIAKAPSVMTPTASMAKDQAGQPCSRPSMSG